MLKQEPETIEDIVREMRVCNDHGTPECQYTEDEVDALADRIEAAHRREMEALECRNA